MIVDVAAFIGAYPFRELPDTSPEKLLREMDRVGVDRAWVGYLPSFLQNDPCAGNEKLTRALSQHDRLSVVHAIDPDLPGWTDDLEAAVEEGAVAVRLYPMHQGIAPDGPLMAETLDVASQHKLPVVLTVRFEDLRQRHPLDVAKDLPAAAVRHLARCQSDVRILVTHAGRGFIEEVHFGLTADEQRRVCYDISWLWGPPADDLTVLCETIGADRFVWGSGAPLRIMDAPGAKLDLSTLPPDGRVQIESANLAAFVRDR